MTKITKMLTTLLAALAASVSLHCAAADHGTEAEAQALVQRAIAFYDKNGRDKSLAEFQKQPGPFVDRDLYVTVYSMDGTALSHINQRMIGKNFMDMRDSDGVYFLRARVESARTHESGWQDYKYFNPVSKLVEPKRMYWQKHDNIVFAAGAYKQ